MWTKLIFFAVLIIGSGYCPVDGVDIEEEIYNGFNAVRGQFPYQAFQIQQGLNGQFTSCGGSLISTQWVLTAAHCAYQKNYTTVYLGLLNISERAKATQFTITRSNHYVHPQYNPTKLTNDIALLKLSNPVSTNQYIGTIKLPKKSQANPSTFDNKMATASGWGQTQSNQQGTTETLQYRTLHMFPHSQCAARYGSSITNGMICTDKTVAMSGVCKGDSGGPLTVNGTDGRPVVIGASSWIVGNCSNPNPSVYVNVAYYLSWINQVSGIAIS